VCGSRATIRAIRPPWGRISAVVVGFGHLDLLRAPTLALFCSVRCPGDLILRTYDLAQRLRQSGVVVISGFHSPMERECLAVLLRGPRPVIACPARGLASMRVPSGYRRPLAERRMLILSPFPDDRRRPTVQDALYRNLFVAALAEHILVAHAQPSGKTEQFCRDIVAWGKPLYTLDSPANANLVALGAKPVRPDGHPFLTAPGSSSTGWLVAPPGGLPRSLPPVP